MLSAKKKKKCDVIDSFCTLSFLKAGIELKMCTDEIFFFFNLFLIINF